MKWLVSYDIADDDRRQKVVKVLLDYGERVQFSVFWVDVEEELAERMRERLAKAIEEGEDSVWLAPMCEACARKVEAMGVKRVPEARDYYVV